MMRDTARKARTAAIVATCWLGLGAGTAAAQQKELSDKSVQTLMNYAWSILPAKFTTPTGKTIETDKKKNDALVPLETARDVIKVGYMSAQAQLCELWDDQAANYDALMAIEQAKKKWTDQQLLYITTLHRMTIHMAAGKLKVVEKGPEEIQVTLEPIETTKDSCNEERKKKIKDTVLAYVKASPLGQNIKPLPPGGAPPPAAASAAPAAPAAQPVPAAQKK